MKLTMEERDDVLDIIGHPGVRGLVKLLEIVTEDMTKEVLKVDLGTSEGERKLIQAKLRHEGAAKLLWAYKQKLEALKAKQDA